MTKNKLFRVGILVVVLVLIASSSLIFAAKTFNIGMVIPGPDVYYQMSVKGFIYVAHTKYGNNVQVLNSQNRSEKELSNCEDFIAKKVDAIVLLSLDPKIAQQACEKANEAKIPFFTLDCEVAPGPGQPTAVVSKDDTIIGETIGKYCYEHYKKQKIVIIQGLLSMDATKNMQKGFLSWMLKDPDSKLLGMQAADFDRNKAIKVMQNFLTAFPDLTMVYAINEDMGKGAASVINDAGLKGKIVLVSSNGSPNGVDMFKSGDMVATSAWSPTENGMNMGKTVQDYLTGKKIEKRVLQKIDLITKDNLKDLNPWDLKPMMKKYEKKHKNDE